MADINEIKEALSKPIFEMSMRNLGYNLIATDEYFKHDFWFENEKEGIILYFDLDSKQFTTYQRCRTEKLNDALEVRQE